MYDNMKSKGFNNPHENKKFSCHIVHLFEIVCNMETIKTVLHQIDVEYLVLELAAIVCDGFALL